MLTKKYKVMKKQFIVIEKSGNDYFITDSLEQIILEMYGEYNEESINSFYNVYSIIEVIGEINEINSL